jgi:ABC-type branched-subunit amino acid transport system ATPase component/ABC-type branched-subunit amino acid transport system permease subunit
MSHLSLGDLVLGLINGMLIGFVAVGLVLVYKASRFLNLAHAQLGVLSTQLLAKLVLDDGWNWWAAFMVCVPVGFAIGFAVDHFIVRPLRERSASAVSLMLLTLGVSQILLVFTYISTFGPSLVRVETIGYPQPFRPNITIGNVPLTGSDLLTIVLVPALVAALGLFLRYSILGKTMRAAASNPDEARLCGVSTRRVSLITWGLAGGASAIAGILQAPNQSAFSSVALGPDLLLLSLGAAALGAFVSIPMALVGGLLIGVVNQVFLAGTSNPGDGELAVLALIVLVLLVRGQAIGRVFAAGGAVANDRPPVRIPAVLRDRPVVRYHRTVLFGAAALVALTAPLLPILRSDANRFQLVVVVMYALIAVSLTIAIGWAGQVSLGQFALVGVGAFAAGHLLNRGWSLLILLLLAGVVSALFTVLIGLPALRVPGLTLAVTTLGLAVVGPDWLFHQRWLGTPSGDLTISTPSLLRGIGRTTSQLTIYYCALAVLVAAAASMGALRRSTPGRLIVAVRDNESAAATFGVTPGTVKMAALAVSGFLAGAAGALWAASHANASVNFTDFTPEVSILVVAIPVIAGVGSIGAAVFVAVIMEVVQEFVAPHFGSVFPGGNAGVALTLLSSGLGLVLVLEFFPQGVAGGIQAWWQRQLDRMARAVPDFTPSDTGPALVAEDVRLAFGGLQVLNGVSIEVGRGEIVGLIGPNGAGKTTLLNAVSGRLRSDAGRVAVGGVDVTGMEPEMRAAYGLSRSFQDARLFPGLTVTETVQVALANRYKVGMVSSMLAAPWVRSSEGNSRREAEAIVERLGLAAWGDVLTAQLSTGTRRICDLAAQVASRPKVLLLDEPTAGVAQREAEAFGPLLRRIREELDCAILIVEHDMPMLMGLCDRIYAMELGAVLASGTPDEVRANPAVIASYLGTDDAAISRSGQTAAPPKAPRRRKAAAPAAPGAATTTASAVSATATATEEAPAPTNGKRPTRVKARD